MYERPGEPQEVQVSKLRCTEQGEITPGRFVLSHVIRSVTLKLFNSNMKFI